MGLEQRLDIGAYGIAYPNLVCLGYEPLGHQNTIGLATLIQRGLGIRTSWHVASKPLGDPRFLTRLLWHYLSDRTLDSGGIKDFYERYALTIAGDPSRLEVVVPRCTKGCTEVRDTIDCAREVSHSGYKDHCTECGVYDVRAKVREVGSRYFELAATRDFVENAFLPNMKGVARFLYVCDMARNIRTLRITQAWLAATDSMAIVAPLEGEVCTPQQYLESERGVITAHTSLSGRGTELLYSILSDAQKYRA